MTSLLNGHSANSFLYSLAPYPEALIGGSGPTCFVRGCSWLTAGREETPAVCAVRKLAKQWFEEISKMPSTKTPLQSVAHQFSANIRFLNELNVPVIKAFECLFRKFVCEGIAYDHRMSVEDLHKRGFTPRINTNYIKELLLFFKMNCPEIVDEINQFPQGDWSSACKALENIKFPQELDQYEKGTWQEKLAPLMLVAACLQVSEMVKAFQLAPIAWKRDQSFEELVKALGQGGPILVTGKFGHAHHAADPVQFAQSLMGQEVWGWNKQGEPAAPSGRSSKVVNHIIIIIGAISKRQRLLYCDPIDGRTYAMSFATFLMRLASVEPIAHPDEYDTLNVFGYQDTTWTRPPNQE